MRSYAETPPAGGGQENCAVASDISANVSRRTLLKWGVRVLSSAALGFQSRSIWAATTAPGRPSTSRSSREEAIRSIPLKSVKEPIRSRIERIIGHPTIYRRLPIEVIPCDPELYVFLVRYPEVLVNMWRLMGVSKAVIRRTSAYGYDAMDGAGTVSKVELVYGTRDQHLYLAEGQYDGPLLPRRVTGRCVLLLSSGYSKSKQQQVYISNRLDVFLQLDKVGVELVAKTLHPLMGRTVDANFTESARFVSQLSRVAQSNGPGVQQLVTRLTDIDPHVRAQFAQITSDISQQAALKKFGLAGDEASRRISDMPQQSVDR